MGDDRAIIIKGSARFVLEGGLAPEIIAGYRHCLAHENTGRTDAALFLWGVITGLGHANAASLERTLAEIEKRRQEQT